jgi:hypothetical protein
VGIWFFQTNSNNQQTAHTIIITNTNTNTNTKPCAHRWSSVTRGDKR